MRGGTILSILSESGVNPNTCGRANSIWIRCDHIKCRRGYFRIRRFKNSWIRVDGASVKWYHITSRVSFLFTSLSRWYPHIICNKGREWKIFCYEPVLSGDPQVRKFCIVVWQTTSKNNQKACSTIIFSSFNQSYLFVTLSSLLPWSCLRPFKFFVFQYISFTFSANLRREMTIYSSFKENVSTLPRIWIFLPRFDTTPLN